jgi:hypothetical protein
VSLGGRGPVTAAATATRSRGFPEARRVLFGPTACVSGGPAASSSPWISRRDGRRGTAPRATASRATFRTTGSSPSGRRIRAPSGRGLPPGDGPSFRRRPPSKSRDWAPNGPNPPVLSVARRSERFWRAGGADLSVPARRSRGRAGFPLAEGFPAASGFPPSRRGGIRLPSPRGLCRGASALRRGPSRFGRPLPARSFPCAMGPSVGPQRQEPGRENAPRNGGRSQ